MCNYGPGANILTRPVYKLGEPGSECPDMYGATDEGLCRYDKTMTTDNKTTDNKTTDNKTTDNETTDNDYDYDYDYDY